MNSDESGKAGRGLRTPNMSRRRFLQVSASGVVTATVIGGARKASADLYSQFTWISPRGTLEVLDRETGEFAKL